MSKLLEPLVLFDTSYVCYKCFYGMSKLEHDSIDTTVIYGFFEEVLSVLKEFQTRRVGFCFDSRQSFRKQLFPDYKKRRGEQTPEQKKAKQELYKSVDALRTTILPMLGFGNIYHQDGFEADDLLHSICAQADWRDGKIIMVTSDEDMYQTLQFEGVSMYNFRGLTDARSFEMKHGIPPRKWVAVKCVMGCRSDEVPGVPGVGPTRALQFIKGQLKPTTAAYKDITCAEGREVVRRNRALVKLPLDGFGFDEKQCAVYADVLSRKGLEKVAEKYGFRSWLDSSVWHWLITGEKMPAKARRRK